MKPSRPLLFRSIGSSATQTRSATLSRLSKRIIARNCSTSKVRSSGWIIVGAPTEIRTPVLALKGLRPSPLDDGGRLRLPPTPPDDGHLSPRVFTNALGGHIRVLTQFDVDQPTLVGGHRFQHLPAPVLRPLVWPSGSPLGAALVRGVCESPARPPPAAPNVQAPYPGSTQ